MEKQIEPTKQNNKILGEVLAIKIKSSLEKKKLSSQLKDLGIECF